MATPLVTRKFDLDARALALGERATERLDQRLNVGKDDRRKRGLGEDRVERLAVSGVHNEMIAESAIKVRVALMRSCL